MNRVDAYSMVRRRTADAGFRVKLGCHVFRATGITAYLVFIGGIGGGCPCQAPQDQDQARLPPDGAKADPTREIEQRAFELVQKSRRAGRLQRPRQGDRRARSVAPVRQ